MRLTLDARARALLRRLPATSVYHALELALMALLAVQAARFLWALVTPASAVGDWRPAAAVIPADPAAVVRGFDPFFRLSAPAAAGPAVVTSLQLKLFGVRLDEATGRGSAIVAGPDNVQQSVAVGDEVAPGVVLKAVAFDHVTLDRGGKAEDLFLDQSGAVPAPADPAAAVGTAPPPPSVPPAAGAVPVAQLRAEIGFIPRIDGGRISGLTVRPQGSGAAFRAAGLQEGDVVTAIGGRAVSGAGDLDRIAQDFASGGQVPVTVERGGQTLSLAIPVAPR
jgi:general secretion pathway protein C